MELQKLSIKEMYDACLTYCQTCECPRLSEDEKAYCEIDYFCDNPLLRDNGKFSRIPVLTGINLERAYEKIKRTRTE